jgi:hypothetical protein
MSGWNNRSKLPKGTGMGVSSSSLTPVRRVCGSSVRRQQQEDQSRQGLGGIDIGNQIIN